MRVLASFPDDLFAMIPLRDSIQALLQMHFLRTATLGTRRTEPDSAEQTPAKSPRARQQRAPAFAQTMSRFHFAPALLGAASAGMLIGCNKPEIRVYTAPKDPPPVAQQEAKSAPATAQRPKPKVTWTLPAGWLESAGGSEISAANFRVRTESGEASVNITPLPNLRGQEEMVINMYRQQAGLGPVEQGDAGSLLTPVEVAGADGQLLEFAGNSNGKQVRIVTAIAHRDDRSWFYRIAGDDALVAAQKPVFLEFIKSVRIEETAATQSAGAHAGDAHSAEPHFHWAMPPDWKEVAPGQMQVAKFNVPEQAGAKADVTVSIFPSDTGGTLSNVNRWRQQIGLAPVDQAGLSGSVAPLSPELPGAELVTLSNETRSLLGAIVPRQGQWFFYKMMGDTPAVAAARESFIGFAKAQP